MSIFSRALAGFVIIVGALLIVRAVGSDEADDRTQESVESAAVPPEPEPESELQPEPEPEPANASDTDAESGADPEPTAVPEPTPAPEPVPVLFASDTLTNIDGWINSDYESLEQVIAQNELTIVQFWTFSCRNCKNTLDSLRVTYDQFRGEGLEIIGVHAPEFGFEEDPAAVAQAVEELGVTWPVALDTSKENFRRWQPGTTNFWPRVYVIDRDGNVRFDHIGDNAAAYDEDLRSVVAQLLAEEA